MTEPNLELKLQFPRGMSKRDKRVIIDWLCIEFTRRPPKTQEEVYTRTRAYIEEFLCLGTKHHGKHK